MLFRSPWRGPLPLGRIWLVGRDERLFVLNLNFEETGDRECDAETELGFVAEASQDRADFLQQFCHSVLLLVTGNDAAQATYRGAGPHLERRNEVEKGAALAGPGRYVLVRAKDWPISRRRRVAEKRLKNPDLREDRRKLLRNNSKRAINSHRRCTGAGKSASPV